MSDISVVFHDSFAGNDTPSDIAGDDLAGLDGIAVHAVVGKKVGVG